MRNGFTSVLDSLPKHLPTKLKESSMVKWKNKEKVFMVQKEVNRVSFSLMIWICLKKRNMEHSHQLNFSDNGWIMEAGMISMILKDNSEQSEMSDFVVQWDHQVMEEIVFHLVTSGTSTSYMLSLSLMKVCNIFSKQYWIGSLQPKIIHHSQHQFKVLKRL